MFLILPSEYSDTLEGHDAVHSPTCTDQGVFFRENEIELKWKLWGIDPFSTDSAVVHYFLMLFLRGGGKW